MRILKLKLRGALGIKKGLGVDEIEIDFTDFKAGLIALTGRNGSGKTTIMENLHPYRCMVSRSGSLQQHFFLKDSYRILTFQHDGNIFESRILIDALTGGSEAYLYFINPINDSCDAVNDGKLSTYDIEIEKLLGSQELFFNSVFSGQKSKGIAELKPAERRKLFYELLNLNVYESYLETAKYELRANETKLAELEGSINAIDVSEETIKQFTLTENELKLEIENLSVKISDTENEIESANQIIQKIALETSKGEEKLKVKEEIENKLEDIANRTIELTDNHNSKVKRYHSEIEDSNKLIDRNKKLLENKELIQQNISEINKLEAQLSEAKTLKSRHQEALTALQSSYSDSLKSYSSREDELSNKRTELQKLESNLALLNLDISRIAKDVDMIDNSNCDSPTLGIACRFLSNAHESKSKLPGLEEKREQLIPEYVAKKDDYNKLNSKLCKSKIATEKQFENATSELNKNIADIQLTINTLETKLNEATKTDWGKLKADVDKAENQITLYEQKIESANHSIGEAVDSFNKSIEELKKEAEELRKKLDLDSDLLARLDALEYEKSNQMSRLHNSKVLSSEYQRDLNNANMNLAGIQERIKQFRTNVIKVVELNEKKSTVKSEIFDWTFLCKAFDKTGIPVLKLENSGVEITSIANDLLSLFENKFRIVFETTSLTKDKKKMKETFDINIVEDDGVCEIGNKSGGQQVWLETAIQLAISLVVRNQGRNIQTAFLDEKDGALDLENAYSYIEMLRKAHTMSGVHNTFIITHRPELLDFIPQQVKLTDGYLQILN